MIRVEAWSRTRLPLTADQAASIHASGLARVELGEIAGCWDVVAGSRVGVAVLEGGVTLRVVPRIAIPQLMFLLGYARDPSGWGDVASGFDEETDLFVAVATAFAAHAERAVTPTPLHGYVTVEDTSTTMRGRIRMSAQLARRPGLPFPLEITYDDFTADIAENRIIMGAAELLLRLPLLPARVRKRLLRLRVLLEGVHPTAPGPDVRAVAGSRLNGRYRSGMALAELILRNTSISTEAGGVDGLVFSFDMNRVFEDFLSTSLRNALSRHGGHLVEQYGDLRLDLQNGIRMKPDITWWRDNVCRAVLDAKYKALKDDRFPNADAYQMLAYCTALGLPHGYLVYAKDAGEANREHEIVRAGVTIRVRVVDVGLAPVDLLDQVDALAASVVVAQARR